MPAAAFSMAPAGNRAGEVDVVDLARTEQPFGLGVVEHHILEQPLRQAGRLECLREPLADEQRLGGMLEDDGRTRDQCRHDRVDRRQIGIVPRRDHHHHAERIPLHIAAEAILRVRCHDRLERLFGDLDHVLRALPDAAELAAVAHRPAHLPGEFRHDLLRPGDESLEEGEHQLAAFRDRRPRPRRLRGSRSFNGGVDSLVGRNRPLGIDRAIDGRFQSDRVQG